MLMYFSSAVWRIESGVLRRRVVLLPRGSGCHHFYRQRDIVPCISRHGGESGRNLCGSAYKKVPKDFTHRLFFGEFFGNADKVKQKRKIAWRSMIFVDSQVVRDMTIGCSKDPERKLFYKWVKDFIKPVMEDEERCWRYECVMMKRICYDPLKNRLTSDMLSTACISTI